MYDIILDAADNTCPSVNMKILEGNPDCFSHEILEKIYLKDEIFREYRETNSEDVWDQYVSQRNKVKLMIKEGKEEFIKDQIEINSANPKQFWRKVNTTTGLGKERSYLTLTTLVNKNGEQISRMDAVDYLNNYYALAGFDLLNEFTILWHPNLNMFGEVLGHDPPGNVPPGHLPPGHMPPGHLPPGHLPPRTDTPCPGGTCPGGFCPVTVWVI